MLSKVNRLIISVILIGIALYIVLLNRESVTVHFTPSSKLTANGGVIFISIFLLGVIATTIVALFFGFKSYLRERKLKAQDRKRQEFFKLFKEARELASADEWDEAEKKWKEVIKQDPTNIVGRVELCCVLENKGEKREALKILEEARSQDPTNVEVLFRCAEINKKLGNKTSAVDNLALILYNHPNKKAVLMARELSEELDRYEDALEYNNRAVKMGIEDTAVVAERLQFKIILRDHKDSKADLSEELAKFVKKHPKFVPAMLYLAKLYADANRIDDAVKLFVMAGKAKAKAVYWYEASKFLIKQSMPERAISVMQSARNSTDGEERILAEVFLARVFLKVTMFQEAYDTLCGIYELARAIKVELSEEAEREILVLKGLALNLLGKHEDGRRIWVKLSAEDFDVDDVMLDREIGLNDHQPPPPRLSTP